MRYGRGVKIRRKDRSTADPAGFLVDELDKRHKSVLGEGMGSPSGHLNPRKNTRCGRPS